jgi:hypothetical protein
MTPAQGQQPGADPQADPSAGNAAPSQDSLISQKTNSANNVNDTQQVARELHWLEKLNIVGQLSLVAVGIIAACIYGFQLKVMRGTLSEMKRSGEQSTAQMWAAIDNVNWLARSADWSQKVTQKQASDTVAEMQKQSGAQERTAGAAKRGADIAKDSLKATIDSFHNEDRAWVGISETKPISYVPDSPNQYVDMTVAFTLRNYGRSAADHVRFLAELNSDPSIAGPSCDEVAKDRMGDVLLPTQERTLNWVMRLTSEQMVKGWAHQNPQTGRMLFLKVYGCIEYYDRKGEQPPHRTPFSYIVFWNKGYITADTKSIPGEELRLEPIGTDSNQTQ